MIRINKSLVIFDIKMVSYKQGSLGITHFAINIKLDELLYD